jgi:hypothetical protein
MPGTDWPPRDQSPAGSDLPSQPGQTAAARPVAKPRTAALIACHVLWRELSQLAAGSSLRIDPIFHEQGLHNEPANLQKRLQEQIQAVDGRYDVILLGYGLCSNGLTGLTSLKTPLVVPRGHDCLTFILGSKERFADYFASHPGTYWYSAGWIETGTLPDADYLERLGQEYLAKYEDQDTVDYLLSEERRWMAEYRNACFIHQPDLQLTADHQAELRRYTQASAAACSWQYDEQVGTLQLLQDFVCGPWDSDRFLLVQPGESIEPSYDAQIIKAVRKNGAAIDE